MLEVVTAVAETIGKEKTGIRLSPYGVAGGMAYYPEIDEIYTYLAKELNKLGIIYIHLVDHSSMGATPVPNELVNTIRSCFKKNMILSGGFDKESAKLELGSGRADLIAFGRPFINNPDLVDRWKNDLPLSNDLKISDFYTDNKTGYTDYPIYKANTE